MREEVICSGFGGQGIMLMGKLLAQSAMAEGKEVTWMPSYGAEVRGGTAHSMVIISIDPIPFPVVTQPTVCIVMNKPSLDKFLKKISPGGLLVMNTSLIETELLNREDIEILKIPATEIAIKLGNSKVSNMVALGAYALKRKEKIVSLVSLIKSLKTVFPSPKHNLLSINETALREGAKLVDS